MEASLRFNAFALLGFAWFLRNVINVTQRSVSPENAYNIKRAKICCLFFAKLWAQIILLL